MRPFFLILLFNFFINCQNLHADKNNVAVGLDSIRPVGQFKKLMLKQRIQAIDSTKLDSLDVFEPTINSPKSVIYSKDGNKFYVNSLEGFATIVFDSKTLKKIGVIKHVFDIRNKNLFKNNETTAFDYQFKQQLPDFNTFKGKPVEGCLSHNGKYLWVTYYRRDWDENAESPSAVAIIDTETDQIVRVIPSGPLPKMIACSPDNQYIAITHWGDNTVGILDISSQNVMDFKYISHVIIDERLTMNYQSDVKIDRDNECGNCLRGTVFSPDSKKLLVAKMGGNGIALIDLTTMKYLGTITGMKQNLRHLVINNNDLILSSNKYGFVQKATLKDLLHLDFSNKNKIITYEKWQTIHVGKGARTIDVTNDGKYIFACVNNDCKIAVIEASSMTVVDSISVSKFPVGMAISPNSRQLIITAQGKKDVLFAGNAVSVFEIIYN